MNNTVEFVDSWGCKHTLTLEGAAEELKAFYDAWPGGLEEIESAVRAERQAQGEQAPFGYFHELLNHEGKGNGVWLGSRSKSVTEQSYIEGEVSKEIVPLYAAPPSSAQTDSEDIRNQVWNEAVEAVGLKFDAVGNDGMNSYLHRDWAFHFAASARSLKRPLQAQEPTLMCQTCGADRAKEACKGDLLKCGMMGAAQSESPAAQSGAVDERERSK